MSMKPSIGRVVHKSKNPAAHEPVTLAAVASIIVWLAGRYGVGVDPQTASAAAGAVLVVGAWFARTLVRPLAKEEEPADDSTLRKVVEQVMVSMQPAVKATKPAVMTADPSMTANATVGPGALTRSEVPTSLPPTTR